jgi:TolB-like protein/DNA-binding winged helix-turn-helix (wHTH) protein
MSLQIKAVFEFGCFRMNPAERLLLREQVPVQLPPKAFDALVVMVENHGRLLGKDELLRTVWPDAFVEESNLAQHISILRRTLRDGEEGFRYIETVPRYGYRFIAEVRELGGTVPDTEVLAPSTPSPQVPPVAPEGGVPEGVRPRPRFRSAAAAIAGLVVLLAMLILSLPAWRRHRSSGLEPIESLAVSPLQNLSGDPAQQYFADGMTEALITDLAKIPGVKVISRTSIMQYQDSHKRLPQIAHELGVDGIVEGSVLRSGDRVRITAQLVRGATDQHMWAESYERNLSDLVALEDEVSRSIAGQIQKEIAPRATQPLAAGAAVNPQAHEDYLKGPIFLEFPQRGGVSESHRVFSGGCDRRPTICAGLRRPGGRIRAAWIIAQFGDPRYGNAQSKRDGADRIEARRFAGGCVHVAGLCGNALRMEIRGG